LLGFEDLTGPASTFADLLNLPETEVLLALRQLEELNLATSENYSGEILWKTSYLEFEVPDSVGNVPLMIFHEQSLHDSIAAFHLPQNQRRYRSLLLALSEDELNELKTSLEDFAAQQLARYRSQDFKGRRLYQLNINFHAVTGHKEDFDQQQDRAETAQIQDDTDPCSELDKP